MTYFWKNGTEGVRLDPLTFLSRLAALIPPPRAHLLTYHGILAPGASHRDRVVPELHENVGEDAGSGLAGCGHDAAAAELRVDLRAGRTPRSKRGGTRRTYYSWAQLMRRVFGIDVLLCDRCGGRRKVLTFLTDPDVIGRILLHLGEPVELPEVAPARSPPGGGWLFR